MKKTVTWKMTLAMICFVLSPTVGIMPNVARAQDNAAMFSDIESTNRYNRSIIDFYKKGIIKGYEDGTFRPDRELTRAEGVQMIVKAFNLNESECSQTQPAFPDVDAQIWYHCALQVAHQKDLIHGYPDGNFYPEKPINLAELLKIILRLVSPDNGYFNTILKESPANDVPVEAWYGSYIQYALNKGFIYKNAEKNIFPNKNRTRGELTDLLYRIQNPNVYSGNLEFGKATFYGNAVAGWGTASGETFIPSEYTAAHKTLPFGTIARVTNLANQKTVEVKINDRGPWGEGRVIDLSSGAFSAIARLGAGVIDVEIEIVYK